MDGGLDDPARRQDSAWAAGACPGQVQCQVIRLDRDDIELSPIDSDERSDHLAAHLEKLID